MKIKINYQNKQSFLLSDWEIKNVKNDDVNSIFKLTNHKLEYFLKLNKANKEILISKDNHKYIILSEEIFLIDEAIGTIKEFINDYDPNINDKYLGTWVKLHEYNQNFIEGMTTIQIVTNEANTISSGSVKGHTHKLAEAYVGSNDKSEGTNDDSDVVGYIDGYDSEGNIVRIGQSHDEVGKLIPYSLKNSSEQNNFAAGLFTVKWVRIK
ncbi:MAG: hypothetical protein HPPSJP_5020 [Candidatus Hepatoplasma scabrum]|nr:MAG: hypothetical protein HPPSJP_5020 [Candidatus Hepatoplasma sp.]